MRNVTGSYEDDEKLKALFIKHLLPHTNSFDSFVLQVTVRKREVNVEEDGEETTALSWALVTLSDEAAVTRVLAMKREGATAQLELNRVDVIAAAESTGMFDAIYEESRRKAAAELERLAPRSRRVQMLLANSTPYRPSDRPVFTPDDRGTPIEQFMRPIDIDSLGGRDEMRPHTAPMPAAYQHAAHRRGIDSRASLRPFTPVMPPMPCVHPRPDRSCLLTLCCLAIPILTRRLTACLCAGVRVGRCHRIGRRPPRPGSAL